MYSLGQSAPKYNPERGKRNDCVHDQFTPELQYMGPDQWVEVMALRYASNLDIWSGKRLTGNQLEQD